MSSTDDNNNTNPRYLDAIGKFSGETENANKSSDGYTRPVEYTDNTRLQERRANLKRLVTEYGLDIITADTAKKNEAKTKKTNQSGLFIYSINIL